MSWFKKVFEPVRSRINRARVARRRFINRRRAAADVFDAIYLTGEWGSKAGDAIYSGTGSRGQVVDRYVEAVAKFIKEHGVTEILDIGCGDFHVGERLLDSVGPGVTYTGIDVSRVVIEHNRRVHQRSNVRFEQMDAATGDVPSGDLCLVRQVMQHLSNAQIATMLVQLSKFRYAIVTEHYPAHLKCPNLDKPHGGDTRLLDGSAVVLSEPPFNLKGTKVLLDVHASPDDKAQGRIVSLVVTNGGELPV